MKNKYRGSSFDDFLKEEGLFEECNAEAVYRNNLKNRNFGKEGPQKLISERGTIADRQGASEKSIFEANPTRPKTDSSGYFGIKRVIAFQLERELKKQKLTKTQLAKRMHTSRAAVNRIFDPKKTCSLKSLVTASSALGKQLRVSLV